MRIEENVSLRDMNTLALSARARFYARADSPDAVRAAVVWAQSRDHDIAVLGGGSNVILRRDIDALVLQPKLRGIELLAEDDETVLIRVGAGENWHQLVMHCVARGYCGIENLALIPGDCGAAPIQNIGAYGAELRDVLHDLRALNRETLEVETLSAPQCEFRYRDSLFKSRAAGRYIVLNVTLRLLKRAAPNLRYPALKAECDRRGLREPSPREVAAAVIALRTAKLPDPSRLPNAGSFFKNPIVSAEDCARLQERFPALVTFPAGGARKKLAAAWLIERAGWKGRWAHGVQIHDRHALVLTNPGEADADAIAAVTAEIVRDVRDLFAVELELEPQMIG